MHLVFKTTDKLKTGPNICVSLQSADHSAAAAAADFGVLKHHMCALNDLESSPSRQCQPCVGQRYIPWQDKAGLNNHDHYQAKSDPRAIKSASLGGARLKDWSAETSDLLQRILVTLLSPNAPLMNSNPALESFSTEPSG